MLLAEFKGIGKQIADEQHKFVDAMMIDKIPLFPQETQKGLKEAKCIFSW